MDMLNESLTDIGCSPLKLHSKNPNARTKYGKRKLEQLSVQARKKIVTVIEVPEETLLSPEFQVETNKCKCCKCSDLGVLVGELAQKCANSTQKEKISILTLAPQSWSIKKTMGKFNANTYIAKAARKLKKESGILSIPARKLGRTLPSRVIDTIKQFLTMNFQEFVPA